MTMKRAFIRFDFDHLAELRGTSIGQVRKPHSQCGYEHKRMILGALSNW